MCPIVAASIRTGRRRRSDARHVVTGLSQLMRHRLVRGRTQGSGRRRSLLIWGTWQDTMKRHRADCKSVGLRLRRFESCTCHAYLPRSRAVFEAQRGARAVSLRSRSANLGRIGSPGPATPGIRTTTGGTFLHTGGEWWCEGVNALGELSISLFADREPMIVPPAAVKSPYYSNGVLRAIWKSAADQLSRAEELVIIGFSLPATDMLVGSMLCTTLPENCIITPVDYGDLIIGRICETFDISRDDPHLNSTYAGLGEDAIPRWVADCIEPPAGYKVSSCPCGPSALMNYRPDAKRENGLGQPDRI